MVEDIKNYIDLMHSPEIAVWAVVFAALFGWLMYKLYGFIQWRRIHRAKLEQCRQYWRDAELEPGRTDWREFIPPRWIIKEDPNERA